MPSPNLLNPANDPIVEARLRRGLLNFGTALATGGPGVPGDIGQGAVSGVTGLLNARMNSIDPTGRVRGMAGQHGLLSAPEVPFSSEAMQKKLGGDPRAPESLLGFMGAPDVTDVGKIVSAAAAKGLLDPSLAHTLFHGTPHKFDMFDLKKIGTGEGTQAYGHGLYFAENPGVAHSYKNKLSGRRNTTSLSDVMESFQVDGKRMIDQFPVETDKELARLIDDQDWVVAKRHASERARRWRELEADESYQFRDYAAEKADAWERLKPVLADGKVENPSLGHLYEVDIPDEITAKMLDWDAPMSEQPESVRKAFGYTKPDVKGKTGEQMYRELSERLVKKDIEELNLLFSQIDKSNPSAIVDIINKQENLATSSEELASKWLNEAGIPGIRFYDGSSRSAQEGTRNIVVFNPDDITHVKRDGELVYKTKGL